MSLTCFTLIHQVRITLSSLLSNHQLAIWDTKRHPCWRMVVHNTGIWQYVPYWLLKSSTCTTATSSTFWWDVESNHKGALAILEHQLYHVCFSTYLCIWRSLRQNGTCLVESVISTYLWMFTSVNECQWASLQAVTVESYGVNQGQTSGSIGANQTQG